MTTPIASFSGLASGIQWQDVVEQIMRAEQARSLDPLKAQLTTAGRQQLALQTQRWARYARAVSKVLQPA